MTEPVTLIVSIDTEEDNWDPAREAISVENIRELPRLDRTLERLGARATYFTTYQVATTEWAADIMRGLALSGRAEVGAHLHPWNTPPIQHSLTPSATMMGNLPPALQRAKIQTLTDTLAGVIGRRPSSFRAGRWGLNRTAVDALIACGYRVDSSVTPFKSWSPDFGPSHVGAPVDVYRIEGESDHRVPVRNGPLIEVPTSWGYTQRNWPLSQGINKALDARPFRRWGMLTLAARLHLVNHVVLSPEIDALEDMLTLVRRLLTRGARHLHVTFHSSSLRAGLNPFVRNTADLNLFYSNLATLIDGIGTITSLRFATVGEAAALLAPPVRRTPAEATAAQLATGKRLLVTTFHFPPDPAVGGMRWAGLTKYLSNHGWSSWVVTAAPAAKQTPHGVTVDSRARFQTLNDVYRRLRARWQSARRTTNVPETRGGITEGAAHSWLAQARLESGVLLTLPDEARGWILRAAWATRGIIDRVEPSVVVSSGPPHSVHLAAWIATRFTNVVWFVDLRDPWAGPLTDAWRETPFFRSRLSRGFTGLVERLVLRSATVIICNTRQFAAALAASYPRARIEYVPNAVDRALLPVVTAPPFAGLGIVHVGTIYGGRDLGPILLALREFLDRHPDAAEDGTRIRVAGSVEEPYGGAMRKQAADLRLDGKVEFLGMLPRNDALQLVGRSRLAVVLAQHQEFQVPAKLYEMVAMGVTTVVIATLDSAASSEATRLGATTVDPEDIPGLVRVMEAAWTRSPERAAAVHGEVDYEQLARRVSSLLLVPHTSPAPAAERVPET